MAVNLSPIWGAGAQLLDNSGNVLSGGKIYTYAAGTTTQVTTYTSNTGVTANSNPIVLNSAGRVPYEIWLTDGQNYKFVLKDSNDVLIGTWDNLSGINSNFIAYTNQQEIQTATAGQTVFNLTTMQYLVGTNSLSVFVDGVNQYGPGAQYAYEETDSTTITFASGLHVGAEVKFTSSQIQNAGVADASQISYTYPATNAVTENVEERLAQYVSVKDFGAVGDGVTDDTDAIQNAMNYCVGASNRPRLFLPAGTYKITSPLTINGRFISIYGENVNKSIINYNDVSGGCFIVNPTVSLLTPYFEKFQIQGNSNSGVGIDFTDVSQYVYIGAIRDMVIVAGQQAIHANEVFSFQFDNIYGSSFNNHIFHVNCGPATLWLNCYAAEANAAGKAGYRLTGNIELNSCNGVDVGEFWGVFGSNPSATDGFQNDFVGVSYPAVNLINCNVEAFGITGIYFAQQYQYAKMTGGKIDRAGLSTNYRSYITITAPGLSNNNPVSLEGVRVFNGTGTCVVSKYTAITGGYFEDVGGTTGITSYYDTTAALDYPVVIENIVNDVFGETAKQFTAITAGRISANTLRYNILTPTSGSTLINVTGKTVIKTNNSTSTTISAAYFDTGIGANEDYGRNGFLIIMVEDTHTIIQNNYAGTGGFKLKAGTNYSASKGDSLLFVWSNFYNGTNPGWVQI